MFIVSMRIRNLKKKLLLAGGVVAVCAVITVCASYVAVAGKSAPSGESVAVSEQRVKVKTLKAPDNEARANFLCGFGWEIEKEPIEVVDVVIPKEFGDVYINYNEIQKLQGFDLAKYQGKKVKRYTYIVTNYPQHTENIRANLLVYKEKVIGGDICSLEAANGFMHGFTLSESYANTNLS